MNLRIVTIWTTGVMLVLALLVTAGITANVFKHVLIVPLFFSGTTLLVSFILAIRLKSNRSAIILLLSTIVYAIWFAFGSTSAVGNSRLVPSAFVIIGFFSLPVMIPVWYAAVRMNWRYAKNQEPQV